MMSVMEKQKPLSAQTFVVRIIHDGLSGVERKRWRATVVDVRSGERRAVTSYAELAAFIEERRGPEATRD
jgi:hypothetical protein